MIEVPYENAEVARDESLLPPNERLAAVDAKEDDADGSRVSGAMVYSMAFQFSSSASISLA